MVMKINRICAIFNYAPHYREEIFDKMEQSFDIDFFFGDVEINKIKKVNYQIFDKEPTDLKTIKIFGFFTWIKGSIKLCFKNYNYYILTGEPYCLSSWLVLILNIFLRKKTYLWSHGWYGDENNLKKIIKKVYFKLSTGVFLYGDYAKEKMIAEGLSSEKLNVIYNSLSYEKQLVIRNGLKEKNIYADYFQNDYPVLIFTGRLTVVKKLEQLVNAQKKLIDAGNYCNVFIVGDGPDRKHLMDLIQSYKIGNYVHFFGECYDENKIADFYYNANCCISPGNVGLTGIHSMTYGCPVISHDNFCDQMPEFEVIRDGVSGAFFKQDDIESLVSAITNVLKLDRDIIRENCFNIIDQSFNTRTQIEILKRVINY